MKKRVSKLTFHRETLRRLTLPEMARARGGDNKDPYTIVEPPAPTQNVWDSCGAAPSCAGSCAQSCG